MNIAIIGSGYVGLVSGACLANFGHNVICVDNNNKKITNLKKGIIPIYEPGLKDLIRKNINSKRIAFTTNLAEAIKKCDAVFLSVGTPARRGDGHADLSYIYAAVKEIGILIDKYTVIITKSTVPVGTGDEIEKILSELCGKDKFSVVSNPEFLKEGAAIKDFQFPDRIVVGTDDQRARALLEEIYQPLISKETPILFTERRTSELIKYASNAFLATKITFINEIANLCEKVGANVKSVSEGIGLDHRIGSQFLNAGPGYGGSCFPKDTLALIKTANDAGVNLKIIETVECVNRERKISMGQKIITFCGNDVKGKKIALLGLSFKPNTDDMRDAPSLDIIAALQNAGAQISAHDPEAMKEASKLIDDIEFSSDPIDCIKGAHALVLVTEWNQYRVLDFAKIKNLMRQPYLIDLKNIYNQTRLEKLGFIYSGIGIG
jgi:UDPglucose 6-dehydrogenase